MISYRYEFGDHVKANRPGDPGPIEASAFVVSAQPAPDGGARLVVEFLADGDRRTYTGIEIATEVRPA